MTGETHATTDQYNFLSTLAAGCPKGLFFLVAKKHEFVDGDGKLRVGFPASMWREQTLTGPWYFSTGASTSRKLRRQELIQAVRAIVIDDVGTKVDAKKLKAKPTWKLETSKGNFQWGYMLEEWSTDIEAADALFAGLVAAGLQDKGVRTACRLFRVPGSLNDKEGRESFEAVLHEFDSDVTYTLASLTKALKVKPGAVKPRRTVDPDARPAAGKLDPVFDWLQSMGMIRHEATDGWFEIDCPWPKEHKSDERTEAKFRPLWASPDGTTGVMCWHGHGEDGGAFRRRFIAWVKEQGGPDWPTPHTGVIDPGTQSVLRKVADAMKPPSQTRKSSKQADASAELYDVGSLSDALGLIPGDVLPHIKLTAKGVRTEKQPPTYRNVVEGLKALGVQPRLNLMTAKISYILPESVDMARFGGMTAKEIDDLIIMALCDIFYLAGIQDKKELRASIGRIAASNYWHPAKDWIESKPWDGQDRLEALAATLPTDNPDLWKIYFRRWLLQCVEAACGWVQRRKSMKAMVLVLVGAQRIGKTSWLMSLAPGFSHMGKHLDLNSHKAADSKHQALQGMISELGELDATTKKTDIALLKAFISDVNDFYRLPYAEEWLDRPRCTSFCGSVNDPKFLNDATGSGRFLPVTVTGFPQVDHAIDMQQLWAQMHTYWEDGEKWWLDRDEEKLQITDSDSYQTLDGIAERIADELERRMDRDVYSLEYSLKATDIAQLLDLRWDDNAIVRRVTAAARKQMGQWRNLRGRGGRAESWPWHLAPGEANRLGLQPLRPPMPKPPV